MLVCSVSQLRRRAAITADLAEVAAALDSPGTGNVVFATLVDDPASVGDYIDAFIGEIMLEAASADAVADAGFALVGSILETVTAAETHDGSVTSAPSTATWDAGTVASVALSGGDLVATNTGTTSTSQGAHVAVASGKTTGKFYFEVTLTTYTGGAGVGFGVGTTTSAYSGMSTQATVGNMLYFKGHTGNGTIFSDPSGNTGLSLGARSNGDVLGMAVDVTNRRSWFRLAPSGLWNNNGSNDPTLPPGTGGGLIIPAGTIIPFATFGSGPAGAAGVAGNVITANFGASPFVGAVPSGFTAGWPP